ncbi:MAG: peptidoglycan-binding protein [Candidatus Paceibacterota bacterium]
MIDKLKFILFSIVVLALVGLIGYWSVVTLQSGSEFKTNQKIENLTKENEDLKKQVINITEELDTYKSKLADSIVPVIQEPTPEQKIETPKPAATKTTYKNQSFINELQKLVNDNVYMKLKSIGTRVGTVQNFLNIYNKTSNKIDNDYGETTKTRVAAFQKDQGLSADGEAGPTTFNKMINWLKKQG